MEGKVLSNYLDKNRISAYDLAKDLGVTPQAVYSQLKKERLSDSFRHKLAAKGIDIFQITPQESEEYKLLQEKYNNVIAEVKTIRSDIGLLKDYVSMLREEMVLLKQKIPV